MTLRDAVPYVAAAYLAVWVVILLYVAIIGPVRSTRVPKMVPEWTPT